MKRSFYLILVVALGLSKQINAQNAEKYIELLVGKPDVEWLDYLDNELPTHQLDFTKRHASGFNQTDKNARKQAFLNAPWHFFKNQNNQGKTAPELVSIPHTFEKERQYHSAWYCSKYNLKKSNEERYFLMLSRVDLISSVYVNGKKIGSHIGAYTPFEFDVTNELKDGDNLIAIFVYDKSGAVDGDRLITQVGPNYMQANENRFKHPGGIDDVPILEVRNPQHIDNVFVKTSTRLNEIEVEFELNRNLDASKLKLTFDILKWPNGEKVDLKIPDANYNSIKNGVNSIKTKWDNPELWSPDHPNLYVLRTTLKSESGTDVVETRFGFREFWIDGKTFMLNGVPTKLRGESHYHLFRQGVDFHREVFNMHKKLFQSNACRVHAFMPHPDIFLGADEAGILIVNQSAVWSVNGQLYARGGDVLLNNLEREYEAWVNRDRNCPSVVIWDIENEMLRFDFDLHLSWISKLPEFVTKYDDTRPINLSGAGWFSPNQDMVSLHMQDHYARIMHDWKTKDTRPLITGEFWVGARADQRLPSAPEISSEHERYVEEAATYERNILEMRYFDISGFMPFRISILGLKQRPHSTEGYAFTAPDKLNKEKRSDDVIIKLRHALQPVTTFFWPREKYYDAHQPFQRELVICNDSETKDQFEIQWKWEGQEASKQLIVMAPGEQRKLNIKTTAPKTTTSIIALIKKNEKIISADTISMHPIQQKMTKSTQSIRVFDDAELVNKLLAAGYNASGDNLIPKPNENVLWVIPEHANNRALEALKDDILIYLQEGGNILCLKQEQVPTWFPVKFQFWSANLVHLHSYAAMGWEGLNKDLRYAKFATILAPTHPIFDGINNTSLHMWNTFDGRVADDAYVRPSSIDKYESGNWRPLAASAKNTQMSLAEIFYGKGTLIACQLHVIENLKNPQAKRLFDNTLSYLANKEAKQLDGEVVIEGSISPEMISRITGANNQNLMGHQDTKYMFAFEGANQENIKKWAEKGGTVLAFSTKVIKDFSGIEVIPAKEDVSYTATKINNHPLLEGISSGNFKSTITDGYFKGMPKNAKVLLQGFESDMGLWRIKEAGPVMISIPYGKGEIIMSTIIINEKSSNASKEFLRQLLSNINVPIAYKELSPEVTTIKKTIPIKVDGKLDEWLDDMEDRFVSQYIHAQPVYLTSEQRLEGPTAYDLRLSGINYFLWNKEALHIAGVIFSEEKTAMSGIRYGAEKTYTQQILFNDDVIDVTFENEKLSVKVNGKTNDAIAFENSQLDSKYMTDATALQFSYINGGGDITTVTRLVGETFELKIPWEQLNSKPNKKKLKVMLNLSSKGTILQLPITGNKVNKASWLDFRLDYNDK
ncbi:Glycosyl hydrolases family 2, sugar binding domain [Hyunsoonleella jejuensis]|uniref:Glycosyl hydrolases family 2, sugar binding domain n=1 Tax=Hyunsoonleella jejuensis TaxID=419940 RepID=A0A1H9IS24_9FLAO|nr:sugar-binding domain-containing protein [Hyunsoonleella jejuensis]SEQ77384.1 Glycosyl hydrolases family 2, sugar binding domain [Hyunsoonleella jejuensis]